MNGKRLARCIVGWLRSEEEGKVEGAREPGLTEEESSNILVPERCSIMQCSPACVAKRHSQRNRRGLGCQRTLGKELLWIEKSALA